MNSKSCDSQRASHSTRHTARLVVLASALLASLSGCGGGSSSADAGTDASLDAASDAALDAASDAGTDSGLVIPADAFTIITFNGGTTLGLHHDQGEDAGTGDGYTQADAVAADALYHNSLSWNPAETALTRWVAAQNPALIGFQEIC